MLKDLRFMLKTSIMSKLHHNLLKTDVLYDAVYNGLPDFQSYCHHGHHQYLTHIFLQALGVAPERLVRAADSVSVSLLV